MQGSLGLLVLRGAGGLRETGRLLPASYPDIPRHHVIALAAGSRLALFSPHPQARNPYPPRTSA